MKRGVAQTNETYTITQKIKPQIAAKTSRRSGM
jgi:hypothetical protein